MIGAARLGAEQQRRVLALMGVDVYVPRAAASSSTRLSIACGDVDPLAGTYAPLVGAVLRALGLDAESVRFLRPGAVAGAAAVPLLQFGDGAEASHAIRLPSLADLRRSAAAKRSAWRELRGLALALRTL